MPGGPLRVASYAIALVLLGTYLASRLRATTTLPPFIDEALAIELGRRWRWHELLGLGKYLSFEIIGLFAALPIDPIMGARLAAVLAGGAALLLLVRLGHEAHGPRLGYAAGVLYVIAPFTLLYHSLAVADAFLPACVAGVMLLSLRLALRPRAATLLSLAALLPVAALLKFSAFTLAAIPVLAVIAMLPPRGWPRGLARCTLPLATTLALFVAEHAMGLIPGDARDRTGRLALETVLELAPHNFHALGHCLAGLLTPPIFVVLALAVVRTMSGRTDCTDVFVMLVLWLTLLPYMLFAGVWYPRYLLAGLVPACLLVGRLALDAEQRLRATGARRWMAGALLASLATPALVLDAEILMSAQTARLPAAVRAEHILGYSAGYGLSDLAGFLRAQARGHPRGINVVRSDMWDFPLFGVDVYLQESPAIHKHILRTSAGQVGAIPAQLDGILADGRTAFFVFDGQFHSRLAREIWTSVAAAFPRREVWSRARPEGRRGLMVWELAPRLAPAVARP